MTSNDIRWQQRFDNFTVVLKQLTEALQTSKSRDLNDLEKQGLIKAFEFTHELSWNVLKDYLTQTGALNLIGSKDSTRAAFKAALIINGQIWMDMIDSRNLSSHTYNKKTAKAILEDITQKYYQCFLDLHKKMSTLLK